MVGSPRFYEGCVGGGTPHDILGKVKTDCPPAATSLGSTTQSRSEHRGSQFFTDNLRKWRNWQTHQT